MRWGVPKGVPFESFSHRHTVSIQDYPSEWLPFIHLYDADLILFPLQYFHVLSPDLQIGRIPLADDRVFGYMERTQFSNSGLDVVVVCNKNLNDPRNSVYLGLVESEIRERLGISNPVTYRDVSTSFRPETNPANKVLAEIWKRVVGETLGKRLPFGRFFDPIFGLARLVASWNSPGGRKSEWIETHYFCSRFGEKISMSSGFPKMDFYLLPTFQEVTGRKNNLRMFPRFKGLSDSARVFHRTFCKVYSIGGGLKFSKFTPTFSGTLDTKKLMKLIHSLPRAEPLVECFNAFDKGPMRTVMFLQMLRDIRDKRLNPKNLTSSQFGFIYDNLRNFYQTPKVIALYAQQCFGNTHAFPIDTWVGTFMKWPLMIYPESGKSLQDIFAKSDNLGKVERLLWIAAQARKVHLSLCDDAIWCVKYDSTGSPRGANPLACNACLASIRRVCPAYAKIAKNIVLFNSSFKKDKFVIRTSNRSNSIRNQRFTLCEGRGPYGGIHDDFTPDDAPKSFRKFPQPSHRGRSITVEEFIKLY